MTCRTAIADLAVVSTASRPLPRLAPSTRPSATSSGTTFGVGHGRDQQHHREARIGHDRQHRADGDLEQHVAADRGQQRADRRARRTAARWPRPPAGAPAASGPRPISTRPTRPATVAERVMNSTTPTKMNIGESQERSAENSTEISAVPTSAPRITASAAGSVTRPWPTKEEVISEVAVLDCTRAVTPMPERAAVKRLRMLCTRILRRLAPNDAQHAGADQVGAPDQQCHGRQQVQEGASWCRLGYVLSFCFGFATPPFSSMCRQAGLSVDQAHRCRGTGRDPRRRPRPRGA